MFTVKLYRGHIVRMVQADQVDIYPVGPAAGTAPEPKDRTNDVREVATILGTRTDAFFVADTSKGRPPGFAQEVQFFDSAFIENDHGATTEVVRPY